MRVLDYFPIKRYSYLEKRRGGKTFYTNAHIVGENRQVGAILTLLPVRSGSCRDGRRVCNWILFPALWLESSTQAYLVLWQWLSWYRSEYTHSDYWGSTQCKGTNVPLSQSDLQLPFLPCGMQWWLLPHHYTAAWAVPLGLGWHCHENNKNRIWQKEKFLSL